MENADMVSDASEANARPTNTTSPEKEPTPTAVQHREDTPPATKNDNAGLVSIRKSLGQKELSGRAIQIIQSSWRPSTMRQYYVYILKWLKFAEQHAFQTYNPTINQIIEFLTCLFDEGCRYSALNTARSALGTFVQLKEWKGTLGDHPMIHRFMKGAFHTRPSLPRYQATWDVSIVLKYLRRHSPADKLNLQDLTIKLATLCSLVTGQRCQTIQLMDLENLQITKSSAKFPITDLVKHSRPGMDQPLLILPAYPVDRRLWLGINISETIYPGYKKPALIIKTLHKLREATQRSITFIYLPFHSKMLE